MAKKEEYHNLKDLQSDELNLEKVIEKIREEAKEEEIPIEAFEDAPFIITEYTPGSDVHRILKKHKIHPDIRYVTRNEFSSLSMVEHELGYSILPGLLLRGQRGKFVKRPLKPTITRQLGLAYSSLENLSPASKTFLEYAKDFLLDD